MSGSELPRTVEGVQREHAATGKPWPPPYPDRPDPLAPPEGYGVKPRSPEEAALEVCAQLLGADRVHCPAAVEYVVWIGCTSGEHAGPLGYCGPHAHQALSVACELICGQCQDAKVVPVGRIAVLKITAPDGCELPLASIPDTEAVQRALDFVMGQHPNSAIPKGR